jgi:transposase
MEKYMTPEQFCYWLQGFSEIDGRQPTKEEWEMIKTHLNTVFFNVTRPEYYQPLRPEPNPIEIIC